MGEALRTAGLVKAFGRTRALDGLDMRVDTGEVHGFLGPNGAGKTTTLRILLGLMRPDSGGARILGGDPWRDAVELHRRLAYVPGDVALWPGLTGGEVIGLLGRLRGGADTRRRDRLVERFRLDPRKKARTYSTGNRRKVALIAALASDAELLLLDEPTAGLDPLMEAEFRECVAEERDRGRTVLLSSHLLSEVEALCDRVSIIRDGRIVESGTLADLRRLSRTAIRAEVSAGTDGGESASAAASAPAKALAALPGVHGLRVDGRSLSCQVDTAHVGAAVARLGSFGLDDISVRPATLEELFMRHYREGTAEAATLPAEEAGDADPGGVDAAPEAAAGGAGDRKAGGIHVADDGGAPEIEPPTAEDTIAEGTGPSGTRVGEAGDEGCGSGPGGAQGSTANATEPAASRADHADSVGNDGGDQEVPR